MRLVHLLDRNSFGVDSFTAVENPLGHAQIDPCAHGELPVML